MKHRVQRLQKLVKLRETLADAAESPVRESEQRIRNLNETRETVRANIETARDEAGKSRALSGGHLRIVERFINTLQLRDASLQYNIERAEATLETQRGIWIEARRDQRAAEKALERRTRQLNRTDETARQRSMDEDFISKTVLRQLKEGQST